MKIKAYFITYRNNEELNKTLESFSKTGIQNYDHEIYVVNNAVDYRVDVSLEYKIISNNTRPSFSTGHLSRNWNECLIDGFRDVDNPDCDIVMLSQNDVEFKPDIIYKLIELHNKYSFIQNGNGDSFHSYTVDSIKKVGLWDERFCNIGCQEGDYFLRQLLFNKERSSIKDSMHGRSNNILEFDFVNYYKPTGWQRQDVYHHASSKYHGLSNAIFHLKWGYINHMAWNDLIEMPTIKNPQAILYPYFEDKFAYGNPNYLDYTLCGV